MMMQKRECETRCRKRVSLTCARTCTVPLAIPSFRGRVAKGGKPTHGFPLALPAAVSPPTEAKPKWEAITDDEGSVYYHNTETGETTWDRPDELGPLEGGEGGAAEEQYELPEGVSRIKKISGTRWTEAILEDGSGVYFFDVESGETTWEVPEEVEKSKKEEAEKREQAEKQRKAEERRRREEESLKQKNAAVAAAAAAGPHNMPPRGYPNTSQPPPFGYPGPGVGPPGIGPGGGVPLPGMLHVPGMPMMLPPPGMMQVRSATPPEP
jgi:hypothetical protein